MSEHRKLATAAEAGATLLTRDRRAAATYERFDVAYRLCREKTPA